MIEQAILKLSASAPLSHSEAYAVMDEIMSGKTSPVQISSYLTALAMKKETVDEITASASAMRDHALPFVTQDDLLEIVGTGGDHSGSFNISTTSAIVCASAGSKVAKHGNRAASSKCGAADCLEALGIRIDLQPEQAKSLLEQENICFLFAPVYHQAMKYAAPVRKELGIRTIFNILGPLSNPAHATRQLMGVFSPELLEPMAKVLSNLGVKDGLVVYGCRSFDPQDADGAGMDEISACGPTMVCEFHDGDLAFYEITPQDFGYEPCAFAELQGADAVCNASITSSILQGHDHSGRRNAVCMNAGAALYIDGKADSIEQGIRLAESLIDQGKAAAKLESFKKASLQA